MGDFERAVLLAVLHLQGQGYALTIGDEIERRAGKAVSLGAIYATLDRLQRKGYVSSKLGEATPERGGKKKRHYRIEAPGERALRDTLSVHDRMWAGAPPIGATA